MNVLILEDEALVGENLVQLVKKLEPDWEIAGPLPSLREAREWLRQHPAPDLILADIQLSDGISLDLFCLSQPACPVIFTTAFDEYAIRAFKVNSIDYLLKPIDTSELAAAFRKYHQLREKYRNQHYLEELLTFVKNSGVSPGGYAAYKENFTVHQGNTVYMIPQQEIALFMKSELILLVQPDGKQWLTEFRSLDEVEELTNPQLFFRANRQFLVHRRYLAGYRTDDTSKLTLALKMEKAPAIVISKEKAPGFRTWLAQ